MWKITYTVDQHFRDTSNYPTMDTGEPESVEGETIDEAVDMLIQELKASNDLTAIISTHAENLDSYDDCKNISIVSVDQIVKVGYLDFYRHPAFASLVDKRRDEIKKEKALVEKKQKTATRKKELAQLKKLKAKYGE